MLNERLEIMVRLACADVTHENNEQRLPSASYPEILWIDRNMERYANTADALIEAERRTRKEQDTNER